MDNIHNQWDEVEAVAMAVELSDPNQPYSCSSWANAYNLSEPLKMYSLKKLSCRPEPNAFQKSETENTKEIEIIW